MRSPAISIVGRLLAIDLCPVQGSNLPKLLHIPGQRPRLLAVALHSELALDLFSQRRPSLRRNGTNRASEPLCNRLI
jgi:hypothetical protein